MTRTSLACTLALGLAACYTGVDGDLPGLATESDDGGQASGGSSAPGRDTADDDGDADNASVSASGLARLTRVEYERSVAAIFGTARVADVNFDNIPPDGKIGRFESNAGLNVNIDSVDGYRLVAESVGEAVAAAASDVLGCAEAPECVDAFIRDYGLMIYRRPLTEAEVGVFTQFWDRAREDGTLGDAMRLTVSAFLQTPDFLYRLEKGRPGADGEVRRLTGYEVASRLSFFLWRSTPDRKLLAAAEAGDLDTDEGIQAQAERLLEDSRADYTILRFYTLWLGIDALDAQLVDTEAFPEFEALRDDMREETENFVLHVFREDDAQVSTLLSADYSFASPELAAFYDEGVVNADGDRLELDSSQRRGVLTHASFLTTHARSPERAPIYRGKSILVDVLCEHLIPPPDVGTTIDYDPTRSAREQIEEATSGAACSSCHRIINPLGFAFENYDGVGRWRTMDGAFPVDATADVIGTDIDGEYANAVEMIAQLAESEAAAACVSRQWMRFAMSRPDGSEDEPSIVAASEQAQGDMRELVRAITATDTFRYRRLPE